MALRSSATDLTTPPEALALASAAHSRNVIFSPKMSPLPAPHTRRCPALLLLPRPPPWCQLQKRHQIHRTCACRQGQPRAGSIQGLFFIPVSLQGWNRNQIPSHAALLHDLVAQKGINACHYFIRENLCNKNGESGCPLDGKGYQNIRVWRTGAVPASLPNNKHKSSPLQERAITNFFLQQQ